ncbi:MAG: M48 family metallopeptidase [Sneathiellales bacterium]|nr:M48 family metallopeptidase [Sneathiellales bacterium]
MQVEARYFDGQSSRAQHLLVSFSESGLLGESEEGIVVLNWPFEDLRDESNPPIAREVNLSIDQHSQERLIIEDVFFIQDLRDRAPKLSKRRKGPAGWWKPVVGWTVTGVVALVLLFMYGLPLLATGIAKTLPEKTRTSIGIAVEQSIINTFATRPKNKSENSDPESLESVCHDATGQKALDDLIERFIANSDADLPPVNVTVLKSKIPNAFALPGGRMVIMSALIEMADHPNAIASVLAHEFGHLEERHPMDVFVRNVGLATIFSVAFGDVSGGTILAAVGQYALGAAYSRDFEEAADKRARDLFSALDYDSRPVIELFKKLRTKYPESEYFSIFSSHPHMDERIQALKDDPTGAGRAFTDTEWKAIKFMCKEEG